MVLLWGNQVSMERLWWSLATVVVGLAAVQILIGAGGDTPDGEPIAPIASARRRDVAPAPTSRHPPRASIAAQRDGHRRGVGELDDDVVEPPEEADAVEHPGHGGLVSGGVAERLPESGLKGAAASRSGAVD